MAKKVKYYFDTESLAYRKINPKLSKKLGFIGLFLLASVFAAVSICCSGFTNNAVVAFLISTFVCLLLYYGFNALSKLPFFTGGADYYIEMLGIDFHYKSISRGVIDSRDVVYFFSIIFLSLLITVKKISKK